MITQNSANNAWKLNWNNGNVNNNNKDNNNYVRAVCEFCILTILKRNIVGKITLEEVFEAYFECRRNKRNTYNALNFEVDYMQNCVDLYRKLTDGTYCIGKSIAFIVTRPKLREVFAADFRDRIIHHLLAIKFTDILEDEMTDKAYACRKGKGTDYGIADVKKEIERVSDNYTKEAWVLKCDIQGFFMSINRSILYSLLENVIRGKYHGDDIEWWLWLWKKVVLHDPTKNCVRVGDLSLWDKLPANKSLFTCGDGKGLPIGNLPSQLLANLLLSQFDKLMIERVGKDGGYGRYVDDFLIISRDKKSLLNILQESRDYLLKELGLTLHPRKVSLQRAASGVRFTGALIRPGRMLPNIRTIEHLYDVIDMFGMESDPKREVLRRYASRINSLMGVLVHYNTYNIRRKAWTMMPYKDRVFCVNMKKIRIMNKYKT